MNVYLFFRNGKIEIEELKFPFPQAQSLEKYLSSNNRALRLHQELMKENAKLYLEILKAVARVTVVLLDKNLKP